MIKFIPNVLKYARAKGDLIGRPPDDPVMKQCERSEQDHTSVGCVVPGEERLGRLEAGELSACLPHPSSCKLLGVC